MARRNRFGNEVKDFVSTFLTGYKIFNDDGSSKKSSKTNDLYSADNLAKNDARLGTQEKSLFGKLFGGDSSEGALPLSGPDRGRAVLDAKARIALENGDMKTYKQTVQDMADFEKAAKTSVVGERPGEAPAPASAGAIPVPPPRPEGLGDRSDASDSVAPPQQVADAAPEAAPDDGGGDFSLFAALGGAVTDPRGETQGALPLASDSAGQDGAGDESAGAQQATGSLDLPRDPQGLAEAAAPAVKAGLDRINQEFKPRGAVPAEDPEYQQKVQAFASGQGRMSDDEIAQLDKVVDPDGAMPEAQRSAARLAAIYKFYQDKGEPERADVAAARVLLYDKFAAQTRAALAEKALQDGDDENGIKLLQDAYNNNMPNGQTAKIAVMPDGKFQVDIGYQDGDALSPIHQAVVDKNQLIQLASNTARSDAFMKNLMATAQAFDDKKGGGKGSGKGNNSTAGGDLEGALDTVRQAASAVEKAEAGSDQKAIDAARAKLDAAMSAARKIPLTGKNKEYSAGKREELLKGAVGGVSSTADKDVLNSDYGYGSAVDNAIAKYNKAQSAADEATKGPAKTRKTGFFSSEPDPDDQAAREKADRDRVNAYYDLRKSLRASLKKQGKDYDEDTINEILQGSEKNKTKGLGIERPSGLPNREPTAPVAPAAPATPAAPPRSALPMMARPGAPSLSGGPAPAAPAAPPAAQPTAPAAPAAPARPAAPQFREGQRANNPRTGEVIEFRGGKWVPVPTAPVGGIELFGP